MSRLRRLAVSDWYFFVTCNLRRGRSQLEDGHAVILSPSLVILSEAKNPYRFRAQGKLREGSLHFSRLLKKPIAFLHCWDF